MASLDPESYKLGYPTRDQPRVHPALIPPVRAYPKLGGTDVEKVDMQEITTMMLNF
jgi:hypothetical protein